MPASAHFFRRPGLINNSPYMGLSYNDCLNASHDMSDENSAVSEDRASRFFRILLTYYLLGAASLLIFALVGYGVYRLTAEVRYEDVLAALSGTSWRAIALAVFFTGLSFFALLLLCVGTSFLI